MSRWQRQNAAKRKRRAEKIRAKAARDRPVPEPRPVTLSGRMRPGMLLYEVCPHTVAECCWWIEQRQGEFLIFEALGVMAVFTWTKACVDDCRVDHLARAAETFEQMLRLLMIGKARGWRSAGHPFEGGGRWHTPTVTAADVARLWPE